MSKVEMEQPVVSEKLAKAFETIKNNCHCNVNEIINADDCLYNSTPEYEQCYECEKLEEFEKLLANMYVLGYEIEKPKLKYIRFNPKSKIVEHDSKLNYLNLLKKFNLYRLSCKSQTDDIQTQFTQSEVDDFLKDEPKGMWHIEEVEDQ